MAQALTVVDFYGDQLFVAREAEEHYVAAKPICERLGVDWKSQYARLQKDAVLSKGMVLLAIPSAGGTQETTLLRIDLVTIWLIKINPNRVKPELRERVILYQEHCARVLLREVFGHGAGAAPANDKRSLLDGKEPGDIRVTQTEKATWATQMFRAIPLIERETPAEAKERRERQTTVENASWLAAAARALRNDPEAWYDHENQKTWHFPGGRDELKNPRANAWLRSILKIR